MEMQQGLQLLLRRDVKRYGRELCSRTVDGTTEIGARGRADQQGLAHLGSTGTAQQSPQQGAERPVVCTEFAGTARTIQHLRRVTDNAQEPEFKLPQEQG